MFNFLETKKRDSIVKRLLSKGEITTDEAVLLLRHKVIIEKIELSSGAKIIYGDDNTVEDKNRIHRNPIGTWG